MGDVFDQILTRLRCDEITAQVDGLERMSVVIKELSFEAARVLVHSSARYAVAERILALGPLMVPALETLLQQGHDSEVLTYAALVLLKLGSKAGIERLLTSLREGVGPTGMIAESLSLAGVKDAAEPVLRALGQWDLKRDPYTAATLVMASRRLNAEVPFEILEHLRQTYPNVKEFWGNSGPDVRAH